jgi:inactivated superfamily I helicase
MDSIFLSKVSMTNKAGLRALTKKSVSQKDEGDLTERWIFGIPTSTDCLCNSTVALYFASMKEVTLMNRYHQTQVRPKPPVEQRVKVMDTLDKKMQSIEVFTNTRSCFL